jgi:hypothetical protein
MSEIQGEEAQFPNVLDGNVDDSWQKGDDMLGGDLGEQPLLESEVEVLEDSTVQAGGSNNISKRVSNAIHQFLKSNKKGGSKSNAYKRSKNTMQQRRKRRSSKSKGLKAYPLVGTALNAVVSTVAKPLQMVDDLIVKPVQGHGRNAIKLVASPLTKGIKALGKKRSSKKGGAKKRLSKRSGKKRSNKSKK